MTRLIDADALIEHLRNDPLFESIEQFGVIGVIEAEITVNPCEEIAHMCFRKSIEKQKEAYDLAEFDCKDVSVFVRGEAFAYTKMNEWIQGFMMIFCKTDTERKSE